MIEHEIGNWRVYKTTLMICITASLVVASLAAGLTMSLFTFFVLFCGGVFASLMCSLDPENTLSGITSEHLETAFRWSWWIAWVCFVVIYVALTLLAIDSPMWWAMRGAVVSAFLICAIINAALYTLAPKVWVSYFSRFRWRVSAFVGSCFLASVLISPTDGVADICAHALMGISLGTIVWTALIFLPRTTAATSSSNSS